MLAWVNRWQPDMQEAFDAETRDHGFVCVVAPFIKSFSKSIKMFDSILLFREEGLGLVEGHAVMIRSEYQDFGLQNSFSGESIAELIPGGGRVQWDQTDTCRWIELVSTR
ncbi:hypothetical protein TNCT_209241 [Trichonephila clavata]|uniref:Uncharacterized protein n=1 Tax=Trichonephila clavata TaxID=2740835 RepID=A0A8X6F480_TRICU|nr:hypothetical protein TNCT_209241 [Trichonephila clavata]